MTREFGIMQNYVTINYDNQNIIHLVDYQVYCKKLNILILNYNSLERCFIREVLLNL